MLNPTMSILGVILSFSITFTLYFSSALDPVEYFFFPIFFLILYHTIVIQFVTTETYSKKPFLAVIKNSLGKYILWLVLSCGLYQIYTHHPFYLSFAPNTARMLLFFIKVYCVLGLPYFIYIGCYRHNNYNNQNDAYLKILSFFKCVLNKNWTSLRYRLFKKGYKSLFLSWLIRLHYLPIMVEQVYFGTQEVGSALVNRSQEFTPLNIALLLTGLMLLIDATNASIGYFWESSLTKTRFRAIDPYPFHWIIVLMCYVPFIGYASNFIPFPTGDENSALLFSGELFNLSINILTVAALLGVIVSTSCLGFSYSNLSYKKIQTKGPYALVRHPGTVLKLLFFFLIIFRFKSSYTPALLAAYVFWAGVYITRAICEERFLRQFKDYQEYMLVTKYRFIPKLF